MQVRRVAPIVLFIAVGLGGCLGGNGEPGSEGTTADGVSLADDESAVTHEGALELPVDAWGQEFIVPALPPRCDPGNPGICDVYVTGGGNFTGTFEGGGPVTGQHHWDPATNSVWASRTVVFTGTVAGCGAGSMTVYGEGHIAPDVNGVARARLNVIVMPGSTSAGLAGLVDFQGIIDEAASPSHPESPFAHVTGTMWCLPSPLDAS